MIIETFHGRRTMKKILGTIFVIVFMAGTLFSGLGCTPKDDAGGDGDGTKTPTPAEEKQKATDELLDEA
jgi:hypothetical protein